MLRGVGADGIDPGGIRIELGADGGGGAAAQGGEDFLQLGAAVANFLSGVSAQAMSPAALAWARVSLRVPAAARSWSRLAFWLAATADADLPAASNLRRTLDGVAVTVEVGLAGLVSRMARATGASPSMLAWFLRSSATSSWRGGAFRDPGGDEVFDFRGPLSGGAGALDEDEDDEDDDGDAGGAGADADEAGAVLAVDHFLAAGLLGFIACGEFGGDGLVEFLEACVADFELGVGDVHVEHAAEGLAGVAEFADVFGAAFLLGDVGDDGADFVGELGGDGATPWESMVFFQRVMRALHSWKLWAAKASRRGSTILRSSISTVARCMRAKASVTAVERSSGTDSNQGCWCHFGLRLAMAGRPWCLNGVVEEGGEFLEAGFFEDADVFFPGGCCRRRWRRFCGGWRGVRAIGPRARAR